MQKLEERDWWSELVELKDVMSLRELSSRFGCAPAAISNALKRNGLTRVHSPPGPRDKRDPNWTDAARKTLASAGDAPPVPTASADAAPAPNTDPTHPLAHEDPIACTPLKGFAHLAGKYIDREVAERAGVSVSAVTNFRRRHGITAATRSNLGGTSPSPAAGTTAPSDTGELGFLVTLRDADAAMVVVAVDIIAAAQLVHDRGHGMPTSIKELGRTISR